MKTSMNFRTTFTVTAFNAQDTHAIAQALAASTEQPVTVEEPLPKGFDPDVVVRVVAPDKLQANLSIYDLKAAAREANDAVGKWLMENPADWDNVIPLVNRRLINDHIADGQRLDAVKALRCQFSNLLGLKEARDAIDARIALTAKANPEPSWKKDLFSFLERRDVDVCSTAKTAICNVLNKIDDEVSLYELVLSQETKDLLDRYEHWLQHIISTEHYEELLALLPLTWRSYVRNQ